MELRALRDSVVADHGMPWHVVDGLILCGSRVYVPATSVVLPTVLQLAHSAGHEGTQKTLQCLHQDFVIDHDRQLVCEFMSSCVTCQCNKTVNLHPTSLLQPLDVLS